MKTLKELDTMTAQEQWRHFGTPDDRDFEHDLSRERATFMAKAEPNSYKDKIVYDMGCGYGTAARYLAERYNCTVVGIDAHDKALAIANMRNAHINVTFKKALISETGLSDTSGDIVNAVEVIEHVDDVERTQALKEWNRILKFKGLLYMTTPERRLEKSQYPEGSHWTEYDFEELVQIVEKEGFKLIWHKRKGQTDGTSMALCFEKVSERSGKSDQNTPVDDINPILNPPTRSCVDRYVILSSWCKNKSVLSISSGYGYGEMILKALGAKEVVGVDVDPKAIEYINTNFSPQVKGIVGDFVKDELDLKKKFDVIISVETFEHITQQDTIKLIETIKRHSKEDTTVFITTPMRKTEKWDYKGGTHLYEYSSEEFSNIMTMAFGDTHKVMFLTLAEFAILKDYITVVMTDKCPFEQLNGLIMVACMIPKEKNDKTN